MESLDSRESQEEHKRIISRKKLLKLVYIYFYRLIKSELPRQGKIVEIGSGSGFAKKIIPNIETSDLIKIKGIDKTFSAEKIPYKSNSVGSFVMLNVLHHIKDPEIAFREIERCLSTGGRVVMIEPYNSVWGWIIYNFLHYEHFSPTSDWKVPGAGRMSDSNTALPWIIFVRDRQKFERLYPKLKIISVIPHTPFSYLVSGGLSKIQLIPTFMFLLVQGLEKVLSPLNRFLGMFATIVLEKTA